MKMLLMLAVASVLGGCAVSSFPQFPDIKDHYMVEVRDEEIPAPTMQTILNFQDIEPMLTTEVARCLKFEVVEKIPYHIRFVAQVPLKECHLAGGYLPKDSQSLYNWIDDVAAWANTRKKCFK